MDTIYAKYVEQKIKDTNCWYIGNRWLIHNNFTYFVPTEIFKILCMQRFTLLRSALNYLRTSNRTKKMFTKQYILQLLLTHGISET
jgi:hypothetical protein